MVFEYTPDSEDIAEMFFTFRIVEQGIAVPFMLVGTHRSPLIALYSVRLLNYPSCVLVDTVLCADDVPNL